MDRTTRSDPNAVSALGWSTSLAAAKRKEPPKRPRAFLDLDDDSPDDHDAAHPKRPRPAVLPHDSCRPHPGQDTTNDFPFDKEHSGNDHDNDTKYSDTKHDDDENKTDDDDDDDYMNMIIPDSESTLHESSLQRKARLRREAEARSRPKSKAEQQADDEARRAQSLATALDASNKGFRMMAKMGFAAGGALGAPNRGGRTEPIAVDVKQGRAGIGLDTEQKKAVRDKFSADAQARRTKDEVEPVQYRERMAREREQVRCEQQWRAAMAVASGFEEDEYSEAMASSPTLASTLADPSTRPLQSINLLWRALVRDRRRREQASRVRHDLSLATRDYAHDDQPDPKLVEQELESEADDDPELDALLEQPPAERLLHMVRWLRAEKRYCFWCKARYKDEGDMNESCPGELEDDHDE